MATPIPERDTRDTMLAAHPIPNNVKGAQKLDEYITDLLSENKKLRTLSQETTLKDTQEKFASILDLLTRLWSFIEAEQEILLEDDGEAISGHMQITGSFEQTILPIGQALNSITYQRRLNVLNTLINNFERTQPGS